MGNSSLEIIVITIESQLLSPFCVCVLGGGGGGALEFTYLNVKRSEVLCY